MPLTSIVKPLGLGSTGIPVPKCNLTERATLQQTQSQSGCNQMCRRIYQGMRETEDQLLPFPSHPRTGSWEHPSFWCQMRRAGLPFLWEAGNRISLAVASDVFDNPDHYSYVLCAASSTYGLWGDHQSLGSMMVRRLGKSNSKKERSKQPTLSPAGQPDGKVLPKTLFAFLLYFKPTKIKLPHYISNMQLILIMLFFNEYFYSVCVCYIMPVSSQLCHQSGIKATWIFIVSCSDYSVLQAGSNLTLLHCSSAFY